MRMHIRASAQFPVEGSGWPRKILIGGATGLLLELVFVGLTFLVSEEAAFQIAPLVAAINVPVFGYVLEVYRGTLRGDVVSLPEWEGWPRLFRSGLMGFGIGLAYGLIPMLLLMLGLGFLVRGGVIMFVGMVLMVLGVLAGVFSLFFLPMALARYVAHRRLEAAFHPGLLWEGINGVLAEYVASYVLCVGLYLAAGMIAAIPYAGAVMWPFLFFYLLLMQARLFGEICARAV
jgi:hypothetical protein